MKSEHQKLMDKYDALKRREAECYAIGDHVAAYYFKLQATDVYLELAKDIEGYEC